MALADRGHHIGRSGALGDLHVDRSLTGAFTQHREEPDLDSHVPEDRRIAPIGYSRPVESGHDSLTHVDDSGRAKMVDVGGKDVSDRRARARAQVRMLPATAKLVEQGDAPKGDVLSTARLAGIAGAKRTPELIPLAHPLLLSFVDVTIEIDAEAGLVTIESEARTSGQTGVEMEAITAAAVAAVTVYDMVKGVERGVSIERVELLSKSGGRHDWVREQ
jgi:cyclic pyranopterin phosphate synthase